jgi:hypothetical protein
MSVIALALVADATLPLLVSDKPLLPPSGMPLDGRCHHGNLATAGATRFRHQGPAHNNSTVVTGSNIPKVVCW